MTITVFTCDGTHTILDVFWNPVGAVRLRSWP
jgi:hypothetical protein